MAAVTMRTYDLCLPWYWQYDHDFVCRIEDACASCGLTLWQITPSNLLEAIPLLYTWLYQSREWGAVRSKNASEMWAAK